MFVAVILFFATFVQGATGFGLALVSMPLLVGIFGVRTASPLISLVGITVTTIMLFRYRAAFSLRAVIRLSAASLTAIPLGIYALRQIDNVIITRILGVVVVGYAIYSLLGLKPPQLAHNVWAYLFGFASGLLSGAYNTGGPPVIIYGSCRRWPPAEFKGNLQGFFLINSLMVIMTHAISGNYTQLVWHNYFISVPAILLGLWAGFSLDKWMDPAVFRRVVLFLLVLLGGRLLFLT